MRLNIYKGNFKNANNIGNFGEHFIFMFKEQNTFWTNGRPIIYFSLKINPCSLTICRLYTEAQVYNFPFCCHRYRSYSSQFKIQFDKLHYQVQSCCQTKTDSVAKFSTFTLCVLGIFCPFYFCNYLDGEERADCFA